MSEAIPPLPNTPSWRGAKLKHRDNFTFLPFSQPHQLYSVERYADYEWQIGKDVEKGGCGPF
jgi:hypothetical protein